MGIIGKLSRLIRGAHAAPVKDANVRAISRPRQAQSSKAVVLAAVTEKRSRSGKEAADCSFIGSPDDTQPEFPALPGKESGSPEPSGQERQQYRAGAVLVILMSIERHFKVINESIEMARNSKELETRISRVAIARNRLEEARNLARQFSLEVAGFDAAQAEINRIDEVIKAGTAIADAGAQQSADRNTNREIQQVPSPSARLAGRSRRDSLQVLRALWNIVESDDTIEHRIEKLRALPIVGDWKTYVDKRGGLENIIGKFFPRYVDNIPTINAATIDDLSRLRLNTPNRIAAASDATLLGVKGIGRAKLKAIREHCAGITENRDADRVERVIR